MNRDDGFQAIEQFLCSKCIDSHSDIFEKEKAAEERKQVEEKATERKPKKDIYQIERKYLEKETNIIASLSPERRDELGAVVISVLEMADRRAKQAVRDRVEQGMLFNILMAVAWQASETYDPAKSKFSTYVFKVWTYVIKEFWRAERLYVQSIASNITPERWVKDQDTPSPLDSVESKEQMKLGEIMFDRKPLIKAIIKDACQQYDDWLCPYCRRVLRAHLLNYISPKTERVTPSQFTTQNVYSRRTFWIRYLHSS